MAVIILWEERVEHYPFSMDLSDSHVRRYCAYNGSRFCIGHEQKASALLTVLVSNVLRIHVLHSSYVI